MSDKTKSAKSDGKLYGSARGRSSAEVVETVSDEPGQPGTKTQVNVGVGAANTPAVSTQVNVGAYSAPASPNKNTGVRGC